MAQQGACCQLQHLCCVVGGLGSQTQPLRSCPAPHTHTPKMHFPAFFFPEVLSSQSIPRFTGGFAVAVKLSVMLCIQNGCSIANSPPQTLLFAVFLVSGFELVNFANKIPRSRAYVAAQAAVSQRCCMALHAPTFFSAIAELLALQ